MSEEQLDSYLKTHKSHLTPKANRFKAYLQKNPSVPKLPKLNTSSLISQNISLKSSRMFQAQDQISNSTLSLNKTDQNTLNISTNSQNNISRIIAEQQRKEANDKIKNLYTVNEKKIKPKKPLKSYSQNNFQKQTLLQNHRKKFVQKQKLDFKEENIDNSFIDPNSFLKKYQYSTKSPIMLHSARSINNKNFNYSPKNNQILNQSQDKKTEKSKFCFDYNNYSQEMRTIENQRRLIKDNLDSQHKIKQQIRPQDQFNPDVARMQVEFNSREKELHDIQQKLKYRQKLMEEIQKKEEALQHQELKEKFKAHRKINKNKSSPLLEKTKNENVKK